MAYQFYQHIEETDTANVWLWLSYDHKSPGLYAPLDSIERTLIVGTLITYPGPWKLTRHMQDSEWGIKGYTDSWRSFQIGLGVLPVVCYAELSGGYIGKRWQEKDDVTGDIREHTVVSPSRLWGKQITPLWIADASSAIRDFTVWYSGQCVAYMGSQGWPIPASVFTPYNDRVVSERTGHVAKVAQQTALNPDYSGRSGFTGEFFYARASYPLGVVARKFIGPAQGVDQVTDFSNRMLALAPP